MPDDRAGAEALPRENAFSLFFRQFLAAAPKISQKIGLARLSNGESPVF
jgi:hypothetical protein